MGGGQAQKPKAKKAKRPQHWSKMLPACKTDFNLNTFKVEYQNEEDTAAVFERFWAKMDFEAYSFWSLSTSPERASARTNSRPRTSSCFSAKKSTNSLTSCSATWVSTVPSPSSSSRASGCGEARARTQPR